MNTSTNNLNTTYGTLFERIDEAQLLQKSKDSMSFMKLKADRVDEGPKNLNGLRSAFSNRKRVLKKSLLVSFCRRTTIGQDKYKSKHSLRHDSNNGVLTAAPSPSKHVRELMQTHCPLYFASDEYYAYILGDDCPWPNRRSNVIAHTSLSQSTDYSDSGIRVSEIDGGSADKESLFSSHGQHCVEI